MSEPSPTVRALRPRTQHNTDESQSLHDEAEESDVEEAHNEPPMEEMQLENNADEAMELSGHEEDVNVNSEGDDYDDEEPRLTIKEEPEDESSKTVSPRIYECKACDPAPEFSTLVEYLEHLKDAHQQKSKCHESPYSNFIYQHSNRLQRHMMTSHKNLRGVASMNDRRVQKCTMCTYVAANASEMKRHHRLQHMTKRSFCCTKCSYVTHARARLTKHIKYHSMPLIKCDDCDFRTPYKWNLDRHTRNHGGGGAHQCRACNFTADIRQSLTVHETNHHEPPLTQFTKRQNPLDRKPRSIIKRYNQVGASDYRDLPSQNSLSVAKTLEDQSAGSPDPSAEDASSSAIAGAECIALKCEEKGCQFITAWDSEMQRHLVEVHGPLQSPNKSRKPVPMLIPLSPDSSTKNSPVSNGSSPVLQVPRVRVRPELAKIARDTEIAKLYSNRETISVKKEVGVENTFQKRNANFFDKLKERLMTTNASTSSPQVAVSNQDDLKCWCTFEASSAEQLADHKKTHHTALSVSPVGLLSCSKCQTSCKNSIDLQMHMQLCHDTRNNITINSSSEESTVNMAASQYNEVEYPFQVDWDGNVSGPNSSEPSVDGIITTPRRVFKCPHCPFWASTASRFHVHIVGHLNRKPFECSLCAYRSNWRWDITKHIKLKTARDPAHSNARVLMTDETGRRNYSKYKKYLTQMDPQNQDEGSQYEGGKSSDAHGESSRHSIMMDTKDDSMSATTQILYNKSTGRIESSSPSKLSPPPARSQGQSLLKSSNGNSPPSSSASVTVCATGPSTSSEETKRTLWKCKRCNYRDANKDMVLLHVKSHYEAMEHSSETDKNPLACKDCPFIATDASALALHQIHHRPNLEAIFKCYLCPYYVSTKTELLEHARLHGEELASVHQQRSGSSEGTQKKSKSRPSSANSAPPMDISVEELTPTTSPLLAAATAKQSDGSSATPPLLLDTRALPDTPLVWVSRPDETFAKMLKCRHCPYVSSRRAEVHDHETMHALASKTSQSIACPDCSFSCYLREVMETHAAMHQGALGTVHCLVDDNRRDAQQLEDLTALLGLSKTPTLGPEPDLYDARLVHCCSKCPARFLCEKDLQIHLKYHSTDQAYACEWCSYRARQPNHLSAHENAHSTEYQNRSRYLLSLYGHSQRFPPPRTTCIEVKNRREKNGMDVAWIVVTSVTSPTNNFHITPTPGHRIENQVFTCAKCPARYFKLDALEYHMTLHGSNNRFKCSECDYSSKTGQNLMKHQVVHRRHTTEASEPPPSHPQSPTDPQFTNFIRGNPNFVYPGYMRNGRLREKRYKCHKCPSAFEKREQYRVHLTLHGAKQRYRCDTCDYSVKYYANYVQHLKKHHANADAQASRRKMEMLVDSNETVVENEGKEVAKSRRKSTISSGATLASTAGSPVDNSSATSISNQDKQSLLLMQKKGIATAADENQVKSLRCNECPFSSSDKETLDVHKRRHGLESLTPPCPHCNYVPRKVENVGDHIRLHFTRMCKPESYLVVELLSLTMQRVNVSEKNNKSEQQLLFRDCGDDKFLPINNASLLSNSVLNVNGLQEKVVVDPNTGETTRFTA